MPSTTIRTDGLQTLVETAPRCAPFARHSRLALARELSRPLKPGTQENNKKGGRSAPSAFMPPSLRPDHLEAIWAHADNPSEARTCWECARAQDDSYFSLLTRKHGFRVADGDTRKGGQDAKCGRKERELDLPAQHRCGHAVRRGQSPNSLQQGRAVSTEHRAKPTIDIR